MSDEHFLKKTLPFAECRYSKNSGRHYKPHMHKAFSIGAIDQGEVIYQVEEKTAALKPGSLALINPEILHACNPTEFSVRSYYMLFLDVEWCLELQQSLWQLESFRPVNSILLQDRAIYEKYIRTMKSLMNDGDLLEKEQMLAELVENIFRYACEPSAANDAPSLHIEHLKRQLGTDLDMDLSLKQLASRMRVNPYTLLRQFKAGTGITPHAYRLNCRIELAKQLLRQGMDLPQVALECGFFDQSHFHRHFKAMTAVTPKEYQVHFVQ